VKSNIVIAGYLISTLSVLCTDHFLVADEAMFQPKDVFELEYAADPQISPDGRQVVYVRRSMDIMTDKVRSRLWAINVDGTEHRPLTTLETDATSPSFSPDGKRVAYVARVDDRNQIHVRWLDTGQTARLTNLSETPSDLSWSPDGKKLVFSMLVPEKNESYVEMPTKPEGADWAPEPKIIDTLVYRSDGAGYLKAGYIHLFLLPADPMARHSSFRPIDRKIGSINR